MLTQLHLKGFKSWRDTGDIELRPITGIFGANSSGKTSLMQALLLLKQTTESSDRSSVFQFGNGKTIVDLGDLRSAMHKHATKGILDFGLEWEAVAPLKVIDAQSRDRTVAESRQLGFRTETRVKNGTRRPDIAVNAMTYKVGDAAFGMRKKPRNYDLFSDGAEFEFARDPARPRGLPAPVKCYGFPNQARAQFLNAGFVADLELQLEKCLNRVYYLGPLRDYPKRRYIWTGAQPADVGPAGELAVDAILAARERGDRISPGKRRKKRSLEEHVAHWLREVELAHDFEVVPLIEGGSIFEVRLRRSPAAPKVLLPDVGFGVSQILPVLVLCFYVPEGSTVILEQPEIHLHPSVQAGLADVLIDAWRTRKVQILLESHSERLLRRLQRRMAEERISDSDIGLYFCQAGGEKSEITRLILDQYGRIENWPEDFFGDEFGEIVATQRAEISRCREHSE